MSEETIRRVPLFRAIAEKLAHLENLNDGAKRFNWTPEHESTIRGNVEDSLDYVVRNFLPSGSGIDCGTKLDESSTSERLVFTFGFHHMDECGFYDGWTEHKAIVTPTLTSHSGFKLRITGRDRNDIKEYLHQVFDSALDESIDPYEFERKERAKQEPAESSL